MYRCKNWFCARSNNNNYVDVALSEAPPIHPSAAATTTPNSRNFSASNNNNVRSNSSKSNQQTAAHRGATTQPTQIPHTQHSSTTHSTDEASPPQAHVVTFLDESTAGGSNGAVTSSRLVTTAELHQAHMLEHHSNLDAIEQADDFIYGPGAGLSLCDDSLPSAKNCYRLVMLGSSRAGKSSIVARFLGNRFEEAYTPTIEEFHRKLYRIRNEVFQLDILDTSGYHPFPAMRRLSFLTGDLFILVFSMDSRESFEEVVRLRENILETKWAALNPGSGFKKKSLPKIPMILAGNKCDRDFKAVQVDEVMGYIAGQDNCCTFVECSARQNYRIDDLFHSLFTVSNLPLEMTPNHHRRLVSVFGAPSPLPPHGSAVGGTKKNALSIKRRFSDACGVVTPNARRPSIRTDLNLMRSKTMALNEGEGVRSPSRWNRCALM
ncbi:GTP-binding protein Rhes isoform X1 [Drosophila sechellia]|uniref:GM13795 n=1 Tax=Drosophila sechellia TaxID=7238 RepID=B4HV11_DROSE|nr:GTP-binding protein Rhes isoform X1 [Drosophila sechellia]XP_032574296.1 GTP-binding protein Rhes isoform X1 [Drosophila sechellia]XP_032574297.1 GTP-binding protein Rhes isoform X1 [Drosophila sechellia]XP_032574298.1 GTP-binding protein Rhes isoform X1 [Drosophila sechellia]XP_032574299.1 GTP-binding protein Rhes isoform X1 [Drosophila sechellia]XP_032574300.1 GTP-binding protein Rhes isoform X1 [Drosophila sechellia]EDW50782.1 GM13795 [Drosophila sechellia]